MSIRPGLRRLLLPLIAATSLPSMAWAYPAPMQLAATNGVVEFEIYLPLHKKDELTALLEEQQQEGSPLYHKWLSPTQFAQQFGPTANEIARAETAVQQAGLSVVRVNSRSLRVSGNIGAANRLLGVSLVTSQVAGTAHRTLVAPAKLTLEPVLQSLGAKVINFSGVAPHQPLSKLVDLKALPDNRNGTTGGYWFTDLRQAYNYPSYQSMVNGRRLDGTGVGVAVLMADQILQSDMQLAFDHEKFTATGGGAVPIVSTVLINGGGSVGGSASVEASLDVQMVGGGAPGANITLVSLPSLSDDDILDGYNYIVNSNKYDVVTSSFGACELLYTAEYNKGVDHTDILDSYDELLMQGSAEGISFLASSGDNGGLQCLNVAYLSGKKGRFVKGVSSPATSAYTTAVGGGNLVTVFKQGSRDSTYVGENGYGDPLIPYDPDGTNSAALGGYWGGGGGVSTLVKQPPYQALVKTASTFRTLPDIGMHVGGCPGSISKLPCGPDRSFVYIYAGGQLSGVIGTSVSSPELAGALALYVQKNGRMGNANTFLYTQGAAQTKAGGINAPTTQQYYHRNISGFDGVYRDTTPGTDYNYIYGNGSPNIRLLFGMSNLPAAGAPMTKSNP